MRPNMSCARHTFFGCCFRRCPSRKLQHLPASHICSRSMRWSGHKNPFPLHKGKCTRRIPFWSFFPLHPPAGQRLQSGTPFCHRCALPCTERFFHPPACTAGNAISLWGVSSISTAATSPGADCVIWLMIQSCLAIRVSIKTLFSLPPRVKTVFASST